MREQNFGVSPDSAAAWPVEISLELFRRICYCRAFEEKVKQVYDRGLIKMPIYLALGQEAIAAALSLVFPEAKQFGQHRCHDLYLCYGGDPAALVDELLHRPSGCAGGMGGSASIHSPATGMFGHDGFMGTQVPIAVGYAHGSGLPCLAVMGDASAEEGYVLGALGEAVSKRAPVLFVCADNGLSILTKVAVRRNWALVDEAKAKGMASVELADDPWTIMHHVQRLKLRLPALLNIHTCRWLWHAGTGQDGEPEWNRFALIKTGLAQLGLATAMEKIETETRAQIEQLWQTRLEEE